MRIRPRYDDHGSRLKPPELARLQPLRARALGRLPPRVWSRLMGAVTVKVWDQVGLVIYWHLVEGGRI